MIQNNITNYFVKINKSVVRVQQISNVPINLVKQKYNPIKTRQQNNDLNQNIRIRNLVIFVPGNPGIIGIYHDFLTSMFDSLASLLDSKQGPSALVALSHNNFDDPKKILPKKPHNTISIEDSQLSPAEKICNFNNPHHIELQVINKLHIIKNVLDIDLDTCKITFVGHSIGCYLVLRMLQDSIVAKAHWGSILLHPAISNLATTDSGAGIVRTFRYKLDWPLRLCLVLLDYLPENIKMSLTNWYLPSQMTKTSSREVIEGMLQICYPQSYDALIQMAKSELKNVGQLNVDSMVRPHINKLRFVYGVKDGWVHDKCTKRLQELFPQMNISINDIMHAFVMDPRSMLVYSKEVSSQLKDLFESTHTC